MGVIAATTPVPLAHANTTLPVIYPNGRYTYYVAADYGFTRNMVAVFKSYQGQNVFTVQQELT